MEAQPEDSIGYWWSWGLRINCNDLEAHPTTLGVLLCAFGDVKRKLLEGMHPL